MTAPRTTGVPRAVAAGSAGATPPPPSIEALDAAGPDAFAVALAPLFEGAPRFLARLAAARPFGSWTALFDAARSIAHALPEPEQVELIDAHPRIGAAPGSVSALSYCEQGYHRDASAFTAGRDRDTERDRIAAELAAVNDAYEDRFGFRCCVYVAGRSRTDVLPVMAAALAADRAAELHRGLDAVVDIARDRWSKRAADSGAAPATTGHSR